LYVTTSSNRCTIEWILDSGVVLMGNDAQYNVVGINTVQIKTHDGIVRILTNVHHIPYLKVQTYFTWYS